MKKIHKCEVCGSQKLTNSGKCMLCNYDNSAKNCKEAFENLKKAYEEYRNEMDKYLEQTFQWQEGMEQELRFYQQMHRLASERGGERNMDISISGTPKEIAALIIAIQERHKEFVPEDSNGVHNQNDESVANISAI